MKTFAQHLLESKKQYTFRIKVAGEFLEDKATTMKELLNKFSVCSFSKFGTTPIQSLPLDFSQVKNCEVSIFEVVLDYPTTQQELTEYLTQGLSISKQMLVVRSPNEPSEEYQTPVEPRKGALLDDVTYAEAGCPQFDEYYGDKYNTGFVKELNDILKLQRKERGEVIPTEGPAKYNVDGPVNCNSILKPAADPRK